MDALQPWIAPYVHKVLTQAQHWSLQGSQPNVRYEDDGSNLRVKSEEKAIVQFVKIEQIKSPIQVYISDSETHVKVTIAAAAAEKFERDQRRRITEGTLGAIFQLLKFEVVAQHYGPKKTKITMLIQELQHIGSDGSGAFGNPRPIECREDIQELLNGLQAARAQCATSAQSSKGLQLCDSSSLSPPPARNIFDLESEEVLNQGLFATQAPQVRSEKRTRVESSREEAFESKINSTSTVNGHNSDTNIALNKKRVHKASKLGEKTHESGLQALSSKLVESRNKANTLGNFEYDLAKEARYNRNSQPPAANELQKKASNLVRLLDKSTKPKATGLTVPAAVPNLDVIDANSDKPPLHPPATVAKSSSTKSEPQALLNQSKAVPRDQESEQCRADIDGENRLDQSQRLPADSRGPASTLTKTNARLRRRDILIPKNQMTLLERPDAWYPPEPGQRPPTANIPIAILQDLNRQADRQNTSSSESPPRSRSPRSQAQDQSVQTSSEDGQSNEGQSDSDPPFSSAQWPASQEEHGLPPDSSIETRSVSSRYKGNSPNAYRLAGNAIDHDKSRSSSQSRQSSLSLSSDSDIHPRKRLRHQRRIEKLPAQLSSASEGAKRRAQRRSVKLDKSSTNHMPKAQSPSINEASNAFSNEVNLIHRSAHARPLDSKVTEVDASDLEIESISEPFLAEPESDRATTDGSRVVETQAFFNDQQRNEAIADPVQQHISVDPFESSMPDSSSADSDLELTIPIALEHETGFPNESLPTQSFASTDPSKQIVMQVERTPLINSRHNGNLPPIACSTASRHQELSGQPGVIEDTHVTLSNASSEVIVVDKAESLTTGEGRSRYSGDLSEQVTQNGEANATSINRVKHDGQFIDPGSVNSMADLISSVEETSLPLNMPNEIHAPSTPDSLASGMVFTSVPDLKRKASEPLVLSPTASKRRKRLFTRASSDTAFLKGVMQDPSVIGRRSRSEFFANLRKAKDLTVGRANEASKPGNAGVRIEEPGVAVLENIDRPELEPNGTIINEEQEPNLHLMDEGQVSPKTQLPSGARHKFIGTDSAPQPEEKVTLDQSEDARAALAVENKLLQDAQRSGLATSGLTAAAELKGTDANDPIKPVLAQESQAQFKLHSKDSSSNTAKSINAQDSSTNEPPSSAEAQLSQRIEPTGSIRFQNQASGEFSMADFVVPHVEGKAQKDSCTSTSNHVEAPSVQKIDDVQPLVSEKVIEGMKRLSEKNAETKTETKSVTIFEKFKAAYSDYNGNEQHFKNMCGKIATLLKADRNEHPSLWDDFIIRHKTDYPTYLNQCAEGAQDPVLYEYFYRNHIKEPRYSKRIVTMKNLGQISPSAIKEQDSKRSSLSDKDIDGGRWLEGQESGAKSLGELRRVVTPMQREKKRERVQQESSDEASSPKRTAEAVQTPKPLAPDTTSGALDSSPPYSRRKVIDLTEDDSDTSSPVRLGRISPQPEQSASRPRRPLPWWTTEPRGSSSTPPKPSPFKTITMSSPSQGSHSRLRDNVPSVQSPLKPRPLVPRDTCQPNSASKKPIAMPPPPMPNAYSRPGAMAQNGSLKSATLGRSAVSPTKARPSKEPHRLQCTDKDETFEKFVQNWRNIKPGNGNSFAKPHDTGEGPLWERSAEGTAGAKVNPFNFTLP
ncbi:MAG: hypothetical protein Q9191_002971 [Dirinaria sp. TL-2023a]